MIEEVAKVLSGDFGNDHRITIIEGQTGTGKSVGYMLGGIPVAQHESSTLVISTATIALQEQLIERDLPLIRDASGLDFSFAIAKGRGRYACTRNLGHLTGNNADQQQIDFGDGHEGSAAWDRPPKKGEPELVAQMEAELLSGDWSGDLDEWHSELELELRGMVTTDQNGCSGSACPAVSNCPFMKARKGLAEHDVIVANHDLVLSDIEMGGGVILPEPEETFYVFDEGHHLPDKAVSRFAASSQIESAIKWIEKLPRTAGRISGLLASQKAQKRHHSIEDRAQRLKMLLREARDLIAHNMPTQQDPNGYKTPPEYGRNWRFPHGILPDVLRDKTEELADEARGLYNDTSDLNEILRRAIKEGHIPRSVSERLAQDIGFASGRCEGLSDAWNAWAREDKKNAPPMARWVEAHKDKGRIEYVIAASPVSAAPMLRDMLWQRAQGAIITSATIRAVGKFDRFKRASGLSRSPQAREMVVPSPFDYEKNASLVVPWMQSNPQDAAAHTEEVTAYLDKNVSLEEGTLVLFASRAQMNQVADGVSPELKERLLVQGKGSKHEILYCHNERIEAGEGSVIFGLASFSEGVDLPGRLCTHVVIAKVPFAVPSSPVEAARSEYVKAINRNPFFEIALPDVSIKLIQAVGRLIRSEDDWGRVTVLDRRLVTKQYGKSLLDALPPLRLVVERQPAPEKAAS